MAVWRQRFTYPAELPCSAPFEAVLLQVKNPTPYTIYIRLGARDCPNDALEADVYVLPFTSEVFPVAGHEFGFGYGPPSVAYNLSGSPLLTANVSFYDQSELAPQLATLPILNAIGSADQVVLKTQDQSRGVGIFNDTVDIPANIRQLKLTGLRGAMTNAVLTGAQSSNVYYNSGVVPSMIPYGVFVPWNADIDTQVIVHTECGGSGGGYTLIGTTSDLGQQTVIQDGSILVSTADKVAGYTLVAFDSQNSQARGVLLATAVRAASTGSAVLQSRGARGIRVALNLTVAPGTMTVWLREVVPAAAISPIVDVAQVAGVVGGNIDFYPGIAVAIPAGSNAIYRGSVALPSQFQVTFIHNAAGNYTYGADYELLP